MLGQFLFCRYYTFNHPIQTESRKGWHLWLMDPNYRCKRAPTSINTRICKEIETKFTVGGGGLESHRAAIVSSICTVMFTPQTPIWNVISSVCVDGKSLTGQTARQASKPRTQITEARCGMETYHPDMSLTIPERSHLQTWGMSQNGALKANSLVC